jgi:hypothetical protein
MRSRLRTGATGAPVQSWQHTHARGMCPCLHPAVRKQNRRCSITCNPYYVGDVDAIMADFAADAVLITPDGTLHGQAQIRPVFETFVTQILPPGSTLNIVPQIVEGDIAYLLWAGESADYRIPWGTDTFVIRAGKIVAQTFAAQMEAKHPAAARG